MVLEEILERLLLHHFINPGGLAKAGDTNFIETSNSGRLG